MQTKYGLSKGKSLVTYLNEASDADRTKLLMDLFHHYEDEMDYEYNPDYEDFLWSGNSRYDEKYAKIYLKCKEIIDRLDGGTIAIVKTAETLKSKFSSEYLSKQIDLMVQMQTENPTNAIGMAKELIESCCKTILDEKGVLILKMTFRNWQVKQWMYSICFQQMYRLQTDERRCNQGGVRKSKSYSNKAC